VTVDIFIQCAVTHNTDLQSHCIGLFTDQTYM